MISVFYFKKKFHSTIHLFTIHNSPLNYQQGIALITALLIVALATLVAVAMTSQQQLDIHRTANILNGEQAYLYALGGESWAKSILWRDAQNSKKDSLDEIWASHLPPLPITGGTIQAQLTDLQGFFNLNNLVTDGQANPDAMRIFTRLLVILELPPTLTQVVVDWIDKDQEITYPDGAEDNTYLIKTPAYRTANTYFSHPSEIRLLAGFERELVQKLLPYITTLPTPTQININTAPAPILMALIKDLSETDAATLIAARQQQPFKNIQDFITHPTLAGLTIETQSITIASDYFRLTAQVQIDRATAQLHSILHRMPNRIEVINRY